MTWEHLKGPGTQKISRSPGGTQTARVGVNSATLQLLFTCSTSKTHTYTFKVGLVGSYPQFMQERCMISLPCFLLKGFKFCLQIPSFHPITFVTLALRFPWMLDPNILGGSKNCWWIIKSLVDRKILAGSHNSWSIIKILGRSQLWRRSARSKGPDRVSSFLCSFVGGWIIPSTGNETLIWKTLDHNILQPLWLFISFSVFRSASVGMVQHPTVTVAV